MPSFLFFFLFYFFFIIFFFVKAGDTRIVHSRLKVKSVNDLRGNVIYCLIICCWRVLQNWCGTNQENSRFDLPWGKITKNASVQGIRCTLACCIGRVLDPEELRIPRTINVLWNLFFPVLKFRFGDFLRRDNFATSREFILIVSRMFAECFNGWERTERKVWKFVQSTEFVACTLYAV